MSFTKIGSHGWINESDNEIGRLDEIRHQQDLLAGKVLSLIQKLVANYVNLGDHAALDGLQSCLSEVMRQASEAVNQNKRMKTDDNLPDDLH